MAASLCPCPNCGRMMDSNRAACVFCQQAGTQPTPLSQQVTQQLPGSIGQQSASTRVDTGRRVAWSVVAIAVVVAGILLQIAPKPPNAVPGVAPDKSQASNPTPPQSTEKLVLVDGPRWGETEYGTPTIQGTAENRSGKQLSYAQVVFQLFDKDRNQVGSAMANVNNLAPWAKWKFEVNVLEKSAISCGEPDFTAH